MFFTASSIIAIIKLVLIVRALVVLVKIGTACMKKSIVGVKYGLT